MNTPWRVVRFGEVLAEVAAHHVDHVAGRSAVTNSGMSARSHMATSRSGGSAVGDDHDRRLRG